MNTVPDTCRRFSRGMVSHPVALELGRDALNFAQAKEAADQKAHELLGEPMLLSWFARDAGLFSPPVECCDEEAPGWVVYANSRGANLTIDINEGMYVFMYRDML